MVGLEVLDFDGFVCGLGGAVLDGGDGLLQYDLGKFFDDLLVVVEGVEWFGSSRGCRVFLAVASIWRTGILPLRNRAPIRR